MPKIFSIFCISATISALQNKWKKCIGLDVSSSSIAVAPNCDQFIFTESNRIKHMATSKCIIPENHDTNASLTLTSNCEVPDTIFQYTENQELKHVLTGYCMHVAIDVEDPLNGSPYVIDPICNHTNLRIFAGKRRIFVL